MDIEISITLNLGDSELVVPISTQGGDITDAIKEWLGGLIGGIAGGLLNLTYGRLSIPFSYKWGIVLESGSTLNVPGSYVNFLPGSRLVISEGSSLRVSSGGHIAWYQNIDSSSKLTSVYPLELADGTALSDTTIVNNGSISVESAASFGGYIKTETPNSSILFSSDAGRSVSTNELNWKSSSWVFSPKTMSSAVDLSFGSDYEVQERFNLASFPQNSFTSAVYPDFGGVYEAENVEIVTVTIDSANIQDAGWRDSLSFLGFDDEENPNILHVVKNTNIVFSNVRESGIGYIFDDICKKYYTVESDGYIAAAPPSDAMLTLVPYTQLNGQSLRVHCDQITKVGKFTLEFTIDIEGWQTSPKVEASGFIVYGASYDHTFSSSDSGFPSLYVGTTVTFSNFQTFSRIGEFSGAAKVLEENGTFEFVIIGDNPSFKLAEQRRNRDQQLGRLMKPPCKLLKHFSPSF